MTSPSTSAKRPVIVTKEDEDVWTLYPTPGFVAKFRDIEFTDVFHGTQLARSTKLFVNIAHCSELPGPAKDLDEDEVAKSLSSDENSFKLPLSVGELETTEDKRGETAFKVDVLVNSTFYNKRIANSEFFRQITLLLVSNSVEQRHGIHLDTGKQVILKNRKFVGELSSQRIRKTPKRDFCQVNASQPEDDVMETDETSEQAYEEQFKTDNKKLSRNYRVQIIGGNLADIRVRVRDNSGEVVNDMNRVVLKMNDDRCVVLLDRASTVADFFLPFHVLSEQATCEFSSSTGALVVKCPIDWNQQFE